MEPLSIRKMAAALGLSKSQVARDAARGMPMQDADQARAWRESPPGPDRPGPTDDPVKALRQILADDDLERIARHVRATTAPSCVGIYSPKCHTVLAALVIDQEIATWIIAPASTEALALETAQNMRRALLAGYQATLDAADAMRRASSIN